MKGTDWIALGAFALAVLTFVATQIQAGRGANKSYVAELEAKIDDLEDKAKECSQELHRIELRMKDLQAENIDLMRKVIGREGGL